MRDNRECEGSNSNGKTDRNGIFEDVFSEFVFDAVGVMLEREHDAGEADASEV